MEVEHVEVEQWANAAISGLTLTLVLLLMVQRWFKDRRISRMLVLDGILMVACVVLFSGGLWTAGAMDQHTWRVLGTIGRLILLAGIVTLLTDRVR